MPGKNVADFCGQPMLVRKIRQLKAVKAIDRVIVSSDSDDYLFMAEAAGAETHKRELIYADDRTLPFGEVVKKVCEEIPGDHVLWSPCTSPLVLPPSYRDAIIDYFAGLHKGFDSLVSFEPFKRYVWNDKGPLNYDASAGHVVSQDLPTLYFMSDAIMLAPREDMIRWKYFHGPKPKRYLLGKKEAVDVDDALDMRCARAYAWAE